jgi:hypothetical protein
VVRSSVRCERRRTRSAGIPVTGVTSTRQIRRVISVLIGWVADSAAIQTSAALAGALAAADVGADWSGEHSLDVGLAVVGD